MDITTLGALGTGSAIATGLYGVGAWRTFHHNLRVNLDDPDKDYKYTGYDGKFEKGLLLIGSILAGLVWPVYWVTVGGYQAAQGSDLLKTASERQAAMKAKEKKAKRELAEAERLLAEFNEKHGDKELGS